MRRAVALIVLALLPVLAAAQAVAQDTGTDLGAPLDAEQFDALTLGRTITYAQDGVPYGTEAYRPGHKVIWAFTESECREGDWFQRGEDICFDYHDDTPLQCWQFHDTPSGLVAQFQDPEGGVQSPLVGLSDSKDGLDCPAPDLGV